MMEGRMKVPRNVEWDHDQHYENMKWAAARRIVKILPPGRRPKKDVFFKKFHIIIANAKTGFHFPLY